MSKRKQTPDVLAEILGGNDLLVEMEPASHSQRKETGPARPPVWEYTLTTFQDYHGWRPRFRDGREVKDWMNGPLIHEYLAAMGKEGWELAAASAGERLYGSADNHQLY